MKMYRLLSGIGLLRNYAIKFMVIASIGINIPLLGIIVILITTAESPVDKAGIFLLTLGLTLLATVLTLFVVKQLIMPLKKTQNVLSIYLKKRIKFQLPSNFTDELGLLMHDINAVIAVMHDNLIEKSSVIEIANNLRSAAADVLKLINLSETENIPEDRSRYLKLIEELVNSQLKLIDDIIGTYQLAK